MCLAISARVGQLVAEDSAIVNPGGVRSEVSLALEEDVAAGDDVIVHVGYALQKPDQTETEHMLAMFAQLMNKLNSMNDLSDKSPS